MSEEKKSKSKNTSELDKIKYLQKKIHETTLNCIDSYILLKDKIPLIEASLALVFMDFRNSVSTSVSMPFRYKSFQSAQKNIFKEFEEHIMELPENCTYEDIDKMVEETILDISKDFFGATFVFHNQNDIKNYCDESDDPYAKKLYKQYSCIENFLNESEKIEQLPTDKKNKEMLKKIDITDTFIDGEDVSTSKSPHQIFPFNFDDIRTYRDYNTKLIELLTLLTNCSMPFRNPEDGKIHKYSVSQMDIPYLKLIDEASMYNPKNKDEWIEIVTKLAHEAYFKPFIPFDVQLNEALEKNSQISSSTSFDSELNEKDKRHYINHLKLLRDNLVSISKDRLLNYILKSEMPRILSSLSDQPGLSVEVIDSKEKLKENGFYALYYILKINNIAILELQAQSEYRSDLGKEGNAAHNSIPGKSLDIRHMFKLNPKTTHPFDKNQLDFYCDFLETVNLNDISEYKVPKEDLPKLRILQDLVEYASSKIVVLNTMPYKTSKKRNSIKFSEYIDSMLEYFGADFGSIVPAHRIEHNQALVVPQNKMYALENILKNRVGFSVLANLIRVKYKEETSKKGKEILPYDVARAYSGPLMQYDIPRINKNLKKSVSKYKSFKKRKFYPMGAKRRNYAGTSKKAQKQNKENDLSK